MSINLEKISSYINWIIICLIVYVWLQFFLGNDANKNQSDINSGFSVEPSIKVKNNNSIADYHIFGSSQVLTETPLMTGESSLKLSLSGTMASENKKIGLAYIANTQGIQKKFRVGEKVFELATLTEIYPDYVVLNRNGRNEKLMLTEVSRVDSKVRNSNTNLQSNKKSAVLNHLKTPENKNWQELMNQQKFDPTKISSIVGNVNLMTDQAGQIQGVKVANLVQGDTLSKFGLQSNDVITSINGSKVNASNLLSIRKTLEENPNATVTIKRNGKLQNIQVNLSDL